MKFEWFDVWLLIWPLFAYTINRNWLIDDRPIERLGLFTYSLVQCENWSKEMGRSDLEMFEILPRDWNLKPIFTQKWAYTHELGVQPRTPLDNSDPGLVLIFAATGTGIPPRVVHGSGRILGHGSGTGTGKIYSCGYGSGRKFLFPQTPNNNLQSPVADTSSAGRLIYGLGLSAIVKLDHIISATHLQYCQRSLDHRWS